MKLLDGRILSALNQCVSKDIMAQVDFSSIFADESATCLAGDQYANLLEQQNTSCCTNGGNKICNGSLPYATID